MVGEEESRGVHRLPHATRRVETWREDEADGLEVDPVGRDAGAGEQRGDPGSWRGPQPFQAEADDRAVLAQDRGDVADRSDRGEIGQLEGLALGREELPEQQTSDGERDARARQVDVRVARVRAMRIHEGGGGRGDIGDVMVVGDEDVDVASARSGDLGHG